MKKLLLEETLKIARKGLKTHPEFNNFPHWSFIVFKNKIISFGVNKKQIPPKHFGYHQHSDPTFLPKFHSELDALKKSKIKDNFNVINIRLNKQGQTRNSMPCKNCRILLRNFGCKKVYFTTEIGWGTLLNL